MDWVVDPRETIGALNVDREGQVDRPFRPRLKNCTYTFALGKPCDYHPSLFGITANNRQNVAVEDLGSRASSGSDRDIKAGQLFPDTIYGG